MPHRRSFLQLAGAAAAAALTPGATVQAQPGAAAATRRTILAIGAHYDDCPFGIPGILLQAAEQGHRVVVLAMIGDYSNWKPVRGRGQDLVEGTRRINEDYGAESRFLSFASGKMHASDDARRAAQCRR